ncbi:hypothetical protein M422DRAFT_274120 [Sphaerobolus stellatus SS14]|uniref:10TM putative phosphate transporter extracellular tail domain-containing protein n=1 Tax=Sphaerobolus stellatus (strain SS14) TaxID=990650 RepID=A0A0C9U7D7_SPHS4|nr:hypothetical protein M422DRAFT_274120 [Sphaerobolus stellatus SS14]
MSLATQKLQKKMERHWRKEKGEEIESEEIDLFNREHIRRIVRHRIHKTTRNIKAGIKAEIQNLRPEISKIKNPLTKILDPLAEATRVLRHHQLRSDSREETGKENSDDIDLGLVKTRSQNSHVSRASGVSSAHSLNSDAHQHPVFDPPAPAAASVLGGSQQHHAIKMPEALDSDTSGDDSDFDDHGFDHPSRWKRQPWIWIPKDPLGLSVLFVESFSKCGIDASDQGSEMDEKGVVEVSRGPPDEVWEGGYDA